MIPRYYEVFSIEARIPADGELTGLPADYDIDDYGATLSVFWVGLWRGDRSDAVKMTGEDHVRIQEALAAEAWTADEGRFDYDTRAKAKAELRFMEGMG